MPNYAPYVFMLFDSILIFAACQQVYFRLKRLRKYYYLEIVKELISHRRKDFYRIVVLLILSLKTALSLCWILYEGWNDYDFSNYVKLSLFWILFGSTYAVTTIAQGDFASVVTIIHNNINSPQTQQSGFWRALLMGTSVVSAIVIIWGTFIAMGIDYTPTWQYFGISTATLNGFITYKMTRSIVATTEETRASTYSIRSSISVSEFNRQIITLFHMRQMVAALFFICIFSIYTFCTNLYFILTRYIILQPFIGNQKWYLWSNLILFNLYLYSMITILLIYSWISFEQIKKTAKAQQRAKLGNTPNDPENEFVIPDTQQIIYPDNIDPNNSHLYIKSTPRTTLIKPRNRPSLAKISLQPIIIHKPNTGRNNSPRSSNQPSEDEFNLHDDFVVLDDGDHDGANGIETYPNGIKFNAVKSPASKLSVLSNTATDMEDNIIRPPDNQPAFGNNLSCNDYASPITNLSNQPRLMGHSKSLGHKASTSTSIMNEFNMNNIRKFSALLEEHKKLQQPTCSMFDLPIVSMVKNGASLERIYYESQRLRGTTKKSLRLTNKMRKISYSSYGNRSDNNSHSRRHTLQDQGYITPSSLLNKNRKSSQSTPNITPITGIKTGSSTSRIYSNHIMNVSIVSEEEQEPVFDLDIVNVVDDDDDDDDFSIHTDMNDDDDDDDDDMHISSIHNTIKKHAPSVRIISYGSNPINITVPENAVLTPHKRKSDNQSIVSIDIPDDNNLSNIQNLKISPQIVHSTSASLISNDK